MSGPSSELFQGDQILYTDKRYESRRLTKISKDGSTLVVVKPHYGTYDDFVNDISYDCDIVIYKRDEDWTRVKSFKGSYTGSDGRKVKFKGANSLDINHDGTVIAVASPYVEVQNSLSPGLDFFINPGLASVFSYNSTDDTWSRENLVTNIGRLKVHHVSLDGNGDTLAIHAVLDAGWSKLAIFTLL